MEKLSGQWLKKITDLNLDVDAPSGREGVLYLAHMAMPFESNGYSTRTHGLISNLKIVSNVYVESDTVTLWTKVTTTF